MKKELPSEMGGFSVQESPQPILDPLSANQRENAGTAPATTAATTEPKPPGAGPIATTIAAEGQTKRFNISPLLAFPRLH
jgi:hypothetical protein